MECLSPCRALGTCKRGIVRIAGGTSVFDTNSGNHGSSPCSAPAPSLVQVSGLDPHELQCLPAANSCNCVFCFADTRFLYVHVDFLDIISAVFIAAIFYSFASIYL